jgi:hypothetical protein
MRNVLSSVKKLKNNLPAVHRTYSRPFLLSFFFANVFEIPPELVPNLKMLCFGGLFGGKN